MAYSDVTTVATLIRIVKVKAGTRNAKSNDWHVVGLLIQLKHIAIMFLYGPLTVPKIVCRLGIQVG